MWRYDARGGGGIQVLRDLVTPDGIRDDVMTSRDREGAGPAQPASLALHHHLRSLPDGRGS